MLELAAASAGETRASEADRELLECLSILGKDFESAVVGIGQMLGVMGAIALGVLLGALIVSPRQFEPPARSGTGRL